MCDVSSKGGKEEEEKKEKEGELASCESVQERRRRENENSALESIWEKAARYWPEHVSLYVCVLYTHSILFMCVLIHALYICTNRNLIYCMWGCLLVIRVPTVHIT